MTTDVLERHHVTTSGPDEAPALVLVHGFGCDQRIWRRVLPALAVDHRVVLLDLVGSGRADPDAHDPVRHAHLDGHAEDVLEVCAALRLDRPVLVGHSVSAMIGVHAAVLAPEVFSQLVLLSGSPRYVDDRATGYSGGFSVDDIDQLMASLDSNYHTWADRTAVMAMGTPDVPHLGTELQESFAALDPDLARCFARVAFLSDSRAHLARVGVPSLVLQGRDDALLPEHVADYLHAHLPGSTLVRLRARGHLPHVSAPDETAAAVLDHLAGPERVPVEQAAR